MPEFDNYRDWQRAVDKSTAEHWQRNAGGLSFDPINPEIGVGHVFHDDDDEGSEIREARLDTFQRIMDFIWADGPNPIRMMRRVFLLTRMASPKHIAHMNQSQVAVLMNETRAATQSREDTLWEKFLKGLGFFGTKAPLKKSDEARDTYARKASGNHSRIGGKKAERRFSVLRNQTEKYNNEDA